MDKPSIARVYDCYLGGFHNFACDRELADRTIQIIPESPQMARANRAFLGRAVRYCAMNGVHQFLDIGSGIPTVGNVHEVAQRANPLAHVVYVDIDPIAVAHSQAILDGNERARAIQADLRQPQQILGDAVLRGVLDLDQPVALLMVAVLHFVPDEQNPIGIVDEYYEALAPGSHLVISHASEDGLPPEQLKAFRKVYEKAVAPLTARSRDEVGALFGRFEPVEPGVVWMAEWRPDPTESNGHTTVRFGYGGVGRKP